MTTCAKCSRTSGLRRGSSTVLVILLAVMLASLAILAVTTSNAGYRLSVRLAERTKDFYRLEASAERSLRDLNAALERGEREPQISGAVNLTQEGDEISYDVVEDKANRSVHLRLRVTSDRQIEILEWVENQQEFELKILEYGDVNTDGFDD